MSHHSVAILIFATTIIVISSLDIYIPATPFLSEVFGVADYVMKMTFLMGPVAALGVSIPTGHYSDIFGRRSLFLLCVILFIGGAAICTFSPNIYFFFLGRFVLSIGGAGLNVLCGAVLADLFKGIHLAKWLGIYSSLFPIVFGVAPIVGAQILTSWGWRWIFGVLVIAMSLMFVVLVKYLPETRLQHKEEDDDVAHLITRLKKIMKSSATILFAFAHSLPIAIHGIFVLNSPFLFIETFQFGPVAFSFIQSIPITFQFIGALCYRLMLKKIGPQGGLKVGVVTTGCFIAGAWITFMGWIPQKPYLIVAVISLFSFGATFIISSAAALLLDAHARKKGLAMSFMVLIRNGTIFFVLTLASYLPDKSIYPIFGAMILVGLILQSIVYYGLRLAPKATSH